MDLEGALSGENLAFYKDIQNLRILTANARALINRSHALYEDIVQREEFKTPVTGIEQEDDLHSLKSLHGECSKCGILHGAHDFCIVQEIIKVEKKHRKSPRRSAAALSPSDLDDERSEDVPYSQPTTSLPLPRKEPPREKVREWANLLYRNMTTEELDAEYSKICHRYGVANGRKFLFARSLAQNPDAVKPLFTENQRTNQRNKYQKGKLKIASITSDCAPQKKPGFPQPCPDLTQDVRRKMDAIVDLQLPCEINTPKPEKLWKNSLKAKPKKTLIYFPETIHDDYSDANKGSASPIEPCTCRLQDCECGIHPICNPPEKKCLISTDHSNNYLFTVREKMIKRKLLKGEIPQSGYHHTRQVSSKKVSYDALKNDSELTMRKSLALHKKDLKNCIASAIGKDDMNLDENVSKLANISAVFKKPNEAAQDHWIEVLQNQEEIEDDEGISGDSDISTTRCNSITSSSTTDREFQNPEPSVRRIPFAEETLKLVDILFDKIYASFRKSVRENSTRVMYNPHKRVFFSHVDHLMTLKCTDSIGGEVFDKLNLHFHYLKTFKPKKLLQAQRLKKLKARNKKLSQTIRRRNRIEGIQVGKHYRRSRKSMNFTKDRGYIGFDAKVRNLLQKPRSERFAACGLVGDESGVLLSKRRIHYQYRLLRTLFTGPVESEDKDSLMDEGMRERLQKFRKTLRDSSQSHFLATAPSTIPGTHSGTEYEGASILKAASVPIRRPSRRDEKKLKSPPGYFTNGTRSNQHSRTSGRLNDYGNETSLVEETDPRTTKLSPFRPSSFALRESRLPTPPHSESSCDEIDFDLIQHRIPPKEEAHIEKSARVDARIREKKTKQNILVPQLHVNEWQNLQKRDDSELTDKSSDSYVPKLLKIPPKRTYKGPGSSSDYSQDQRGAAYGKTFRVRARSSYLSDSSSTDTEPDNPLRNIRRERPAWDHKSGLNREVAPYIGTYAKQHDDVHPSGRRTANYDSRRTRKLKNTFASPLPKAGPSVLKNSSLPKPPSDETSKNQSNTHGFDINPVKRQSLSESRYRTTSRPSEGLIKQALVVTERLLKSTRGNPEVDVSSISTNKPSTQSRATPDVFPSSPISGGGPHKASVLGVSKSGEVETEDGDSSPRWSVTIKEPKASSTSHHTGRKSPDAATANTAESNQLKRNDSLIASPPKRLSRRVSKVVNEVFRRRSVVTSERSVKKELHTKTKAPKKYAVDDVPSVQNTSISSVAAKLKKLEAVGPTKKKCFNLDIGQGINCVNYLKENAPGADENKKKELVDLLVTPVEVKKSPKKTAAKVETGSSLESALIISQQSAVESISASQISANQSVRSTKIQTQPAHYQKPLRKNSFQTLDEIYKKVHGINEKNTPKKLLDRDYEYEAKTRQQLKKHKIFP